MTKGQRTALYLVAAVPAGFLPLVYVWMILNVFWGVATGTDISPTEGTVFWWCGWVAIYATLAQWPFYFAWAAISRELTNRQRIAWVIVIFLLNMFAMPWFLWCKYRTNTRNGLLGLIGPKWLRQYLA